MALGERLRAAREEKGLRGYQLADYHYPAHLTTDTVDAIEAAVYGEADAHPMRTPSAWRHRLDTLCARFADSRPRHKAR
jgi:predicted metal-dependent phosphoesterase TrpH